MLTIITALEDFGIHKTYETKNWNVPRLYFVFFIKKHHKKCGSNFKDSGVLGPSFEDA